MECVLGGLGTDNPRGTTVDRGSRLSLPGDEGEVVCRGQERDGVEMEGLSVWEGETQEERPKIRRYVCAFGVWYLWRSDCRWMYQFLPQQNLALFGPHEDLKQYLSYKPNVCIPVDKHEIQAMGYMNLRRVA